MKERILVTGATGYIGSHTIVDLLEQDYQIVGIDNLVNSSIQVIDRIKKITGKSFEFFECDLRDKPSLSDVFKSFDFDKVIHFAGYKAVGESVQEPNIYFSNNFVGSQILFETMAECEVKNLVFSSSCTVYGNPKDVPLSEQSDLNPTNPYGRTKYWIELMLQDLCNSDPNWNVISLRYFNPVGAHESGWIGEDPLGVPNNLMPFITQTAIGIREELKIFGKDYNTPDGTCLRDYIHVCDLSLGHIKALEKIGLNKGFLPINLGTGNGVSVLELVHTFAEVNKVTVNYSFADRREGDAVKVWADPTFAYDFLHWKTEKDIKDMVRDAWNWQKKNPNGYN